MKGKPTSLITGATGFVGSHLVYHLLELGWSVHVIRRQSSKSDILQGVESQIISHVIDGSFRSLNEAVQTSQPDVVLHLASLFLAEHDSADIDPMFESNLTFPTKLAEAMVKHNKRTFVNAGTAWQHFHNGAYNPVCLYGATKQAFEAILKYYVEAHALKVTGLKLFDTYGPADSRKKLFAALGDSAKANQPLKMTDGLQKIDLVYIDDATRAFALAAERQLNGKAGKWESFSINTRRPVTLRHVVALYEKSIGRKLPIEWGGRPHRQRELMIPWKGEKWIPGWKPKIHLEAGIRQLAKDL